jgi:hypothetical protein
LLFISTLFACSGNCLLCHPILEKSIEKKHHKVLKTCINCHTKLPEGMTQCGGDCFDCHSQKKLAQSEQFEHQQIKTCKQCHVNKRELLKMMDSSSDLIDILNQR